jgi:hypothetical protein
MIPTFVGMASGDVTAVSGEPPGGDRVGSLGSRGSEPGTGVVDVYRRAADSMRDATKWVMAFVPGAAILLSLAGLIPKLSDVKPSSDAWATTILWMIGGIVAASAAMVAAARVLTAGSVGWGQLVDTIFRDRKHEGVGGPSGRKLSAELDKEGVLDLYGYGSVADLLAALSEQDPALRPAIIAAGSTAMDFAAYRSVRGRFWWFAVVGGIALTATVFCLAMASLTIAEAPIRPARVSAPLEVHLVPNTAGRSAVNKAVGCSTSGAVHAWAVGGSLSDPVVIIDTGDTHCSPASLDWKSGWGPAVPSPGPSRPGS